MGLLRRAKLTLRGATTRAVNHWDRMRLAKEPWDVSIFYEFLPPPHGGGNQFMWAIRREMERRGLRVGINAISDSTRACLFNSHQFDFHRIRLMRRPSCRMVHRVDGPLKLYRGMDNGTDQRLWDLNEEIADATIFQSEFSLQASADLGMKIKNPTVIRNTVDRSIFHPPTAPSPLDGRRVRLIATSWSDNPNKGASIYQWLDQHLDFDRFEFTFLGRSPVTYDNIKMLAPLPSDQVADTLRQNDIFITASLHDPCSNSVLEALACGLPVLHLNSGGHPEIVGEAGLCFDEVEQIPSLLDQMVERNGEFRSKISLPSITEVADRYLEVMEIAEGTTR